jgi:hypothetical protein
LELFSKDCPIRGWEFPLTLLGEVLGFVNEGFLTLLFTISVISKEESLTEELDLTPKPTLYSTHASRFLRGWVEENYISGIS